MKSGKCVVAIVSLGLVSAAGAEVIDFDGFTGEVTNQFASATFSSDAGFSNFATGFPTAHSGANILCTGVQGAIDCLQPTYVDFTNPVNDLSFWAIEANAVGVTAQFNVYENGAFSATVDLVSSGGFGNNEFVDLSAFSNVTRLEIVNIFNDFSTENGIGWDTFSFTVVPAPGSAVLMAMGLLSAGRRRR